MALLRRPLPGLDATSQSLHVSEEVINAAGQSSSQLMNDANNTNRSFDGNAPESKVAWLASHSYSADPQRNGLVEYVDLCFPAIIWVYHFVPGCFIY